jgi:hypothetical protein
LTIRSPSQAILSLSPDGTGASSNEGVPPGDNFFQSHGYPIVKFNGSSGKRFGRGDGSRCVKVVVEDGGQGRFNHLTF